MSGRWFFVKFRLINGIYVVALKALFVLGVPATPMAAYKCLLLLNTVFASVSVTLFYTRFAKVHAVHAKTAVIITALFATTFMTWGYFTTIEVYPLIFMIGMVAVYAMCDANNYKSMPSRVGMIHGVAALFHIRYVLSGVVPT